MNNDEERVEFTGWKVDQLDFPTFRIGLIAKLMDRATIRQLAQVTDLSYAQWRVLSRLSLMPEGGTVGDIARLAWVDRAEVSRAVAVLEAQGFVSRRDNAADRRAPLLALTVQGEVVRREVLAKRIAFHEHLLAGLSPTDRETLDILLARIGESLLGDLDQG